MWYGGACSEFKTELFITIVIILVLYLVFDLTEHEIIMRTGFSRSINIDCIRPQILQIYETIIWLYHHYQN